MSIEEKLDKILKQAVRKARVTDSTAWYFNSDWHKQQILELIKEVTDTGIKSGFYAGQAMAGIELDDCHDNWKKWNEPIKRGQRNENSTK